MFKCALSGCSKSPSPLTALGEFGSPEVSIVKWKVLRSFIASDDLVSRSAAGPVSFVPPGTPRPEAPAAVAVGATTAAVVAVAGAVVAVGGATVSVGAGTGVAVGSLPHPYRSRPVIIAP